MEDLSNQDQNEAAATSAIPISDGADEAVLMVEDDAELKALIAKIEALFPGSPHPDVTELRITGIKDFEATAGIPFFGIVFAANVRGAHTVTEVGASELPSVSDEPTEIEKLVIAGLVGNAVDALLMRRAYDDGIPTIYEDGVPQPHEETEWDAEAAALLRKAGINVRTRAAGQDEGESEAAPEEPILIVPTIGRRVWYWPSIDDIDHAYDPVLKVLDKAQAMDAGIVYVHDDRRVNLSVKDHHGKSFARLNVQLIQEGDTVPTGGGYAAWMPYQKNSASRKA